MFVDGEGKVRYEQSVGASPRRVGFGKVPAAKVEGVHEILRKESFCGLAPKKRESAPGYIIVEARFTDVACSVELPDAKWDKDPKAKRVMDALRKLEAEACPTGCKP